MSSRFIILLSACIVLSCAEKPRNDSMKVIAHRGGASLGPENTLNCIQKGILSGADAIEIDVHQSADNRLIVCHDETIDRTTYGSGRIEEMTLSEIQSARIKGGEPSERIPTLDEVIEIAKDKCVLLIEVKRSREGQYPMIEDKIVALINSFGISDKVVFQSFNDSVLERFHSIAPEIPLEKLLVCRLPFGFAFDIKLHKFSMDDYPYVRSFNSYNLFTTDRFIRDAHNRGKTVRVWTVDKPSRVKKNADAVITNCPQLFTTSF